MPAGTSRFIATLFCGLFCAPTHYQQCCAIDTPFRVGRFGQEVALHRERQNGLRSANVLRVTSDDKGRIVAETNQGFANWEGNEWRPCSPISVPKPPSLPVDTKSSQLASSGDGEKWALSSQRGLFETVTGHDWQKLKIADGLGRLWADSDVRGVTYDVKGQLWFATLAGVGCRELNGEWRFFEGKDGLPYNDFTCVAAGSDGSVWFGTRRGAIRFFDGKWAYRQGPRWLPHDEVRAIHVDDQNNAWFATPAGVGCIARRSLTLSEKASLYEAEIDRYIKRTSYGYVASSQLGAPGDKSQITHHDSDNDGLWTAMYGASQCLAYAVTESEASRERAKQAFEALRFLQVVTQGGDHSPPRGYVARTVLPISSSDPNRGRFAHDREFRETRDHLWKVYEPRWPKSADGQWYWKSDTSSDELDGHYFFYPLYYDLVAETAAEKSRVREVVGQLTDHLIEHDFVLQDHDGKPTRWGVYRPSSLNHDINWVDERGINSLSMLSYLAVAHHVTGDDRYEGIALELRERHNYATNAMVPKMQRGIGSGNQSDDEMAFMSFFNLIKYTQDHELRSRYLSAFHSYWMLEQPERNPFFHFAYAAFAAEETLSTPFGERDLAPSGDWLRDSVETLTGFPLDRMNWPHTNSHRLDIVALPRQQARDLHGTNRNEGRLIRGYRVDGKVLPVEERFFSHWNTDPWQLDYGGDGRTLACGSVFLLPYYMGRYHGLIE